MAVPTWSQLTFLSAAQQTKAAEFATIGAALGGPKPTVPNTSGVTYSQAKAAEALLRDLYALVGPAIAGIKYVREKELAANKAAFEAANP